MVSATASVHCPWPSATTRIFCVHLLTLHQMGAIFSRDSRHRIVLRWKLSPARYEGLRSTVTDVLNKIWELHNKDPRRVGQIIVRPRHNDNDLGILAIPEAPSNVWVVEVLGEVLWREKDDARTTWVMTYRDSDLKELFGTIAP